MMLMKNTIDFNMISNDLLECYGKSYKNYRRTLNMEILTIEGVIKCLIWSFKEKQI